MCAASTKRWSPTTHAIAKNKTAVATSPSCPSAHLLKSLRSAYFVAKNADGKNDGARLGSPTSFGQRRENTCHAVFADGAQDLGCTPA